MNKTYLVTKHFGKSMMHHVAMPVIGETAAEKLANGAKKKHTDFQGRVTVCRWLLVEEIEVPKTSSKGKK